MHAFHFFFRYTHFKKYKYLKIILEKKYSGQTLKKNYQVVYYYNRFINNQTHKRWSIATTCQLRNLGARWELTSSCDWPDVTRLLSIVFHSQHYMVHLYRLCTLPSLPMQRERESYIYQYIYRNSEGEGVYPSGFNKNAVRG